MDPVMPSLTWFSSFFLISVIGAVSATTADLSSTAITVIMIICGILMIAIPLFIFWGLKTDVDYDGKYIRLKSFFKKKEIDLQKVKSVEYQHEGKRKSAYFSIRLKFVYYEDEDGYCDTDVLNEDISNDELDGLIKGDHSCSNLLLMYDNIIELYPDKQK